MIRQFSVLSLFTLLLFTVSSGIISSSLSLQVTTTAFAQPFSSSSSLADEIIDETTSSSVQDSSSDENVLDDSNEFGDEDAAINQDNEEDQDDANVGLQDQESEQAQDSEQEAANTNVDLDVQEGVQQPLSLPTPPTPGPPSPPPPPVVITCAGEPATRVGTANGETIIGTAARDVIAALGGQ
jgi:hypothetical protein